MENQDVNLKDDTLDLSSETEANKEPKVEERTVPLQALQEERRKRQELEQRIASLENSYKPSSTSEDSNPDLEDAINKIEPYLRKKGFLTRDQVEEEKSANAYAEEMKTLSNKYDGKDGRPAFDAYEVAEYGKKNRIFNLEVAYEQLNKKELLDWSMKKAGTSSDNVETEKASTSGYKEAGNSSILSRDALAQRLAKPDGREWWEKNADKIHAAMSRGEIS